MSSVKNLTSKINQLLAKAANLLITNFIKNSAALLKINFIQTMIKKLYFPKNP